MIPFQPNLGHARNSIVGVASLGMCVILLKKFIYNINFVKKINYWIASKKFEFEFIVCEKATLVMVCCPCFGMYC